jgi:hypothetical protein
MPATGSAWFVAKAAIALGPIIGFGTADMIRWLLRRMGWQDRQMGQQSRHGSFRFPLN